MCRTFGDAEAKLTFRGGNPNVVSATPEITKFLISREHDFIVLGSDGIFDKITDAECAKCVWLSCGTAKDGQNGKALTVH